MESLLQFSAVVQQMSQCRLGPGRFRSRHLNMHPRRNETVMGDIPNLYIGPEKRKKKREFDQHTKFGGRKKQTNFTSVRTDSTLLPKVRVVFTKRNLSPLVYDSFVNEIKQDFEGKKREKLYIVAGEWNTMFSA